MPECAQQLWSDFLQLHGSREISERGPCPIRFAELDAYARLMGFAWSPWEVAVIKRLDALARTDRLHPAEFEPVGAVKGLLAGVQDRQRGSTNARRR